MTLSRLIRINLKTKIFPRKQRHIFHPIVFVPFCVLSALMEKTEPGFKFIWTSTDGVKQCENMAMDVRCYEVYLKKIAHVVSM